jgi:hypothetical protein
MSRARTAALALALAAVPAHAQAPNEVTLGAGLLSGEFTYARRLGRGPVSVGAGAWGAWEPPSSFDRNVWEPLGVSVFARVRPAPWAHADFGPTVARYVRADDCSDTCVGTLAGVRAVAMVGYRWVFAGPEVVVGRATDDRYGSDVGALWGVQVRGVLGWGR